MLLKASGKFSFGFAWFQQLIVELETLRVPAYRAHGQDVKD